LVDTVKKPGPRYSTSFLRWLENYDKKVSSSGGAGCSPARGQVKTAFEKQKLIVVHTVQSPPLF